MVVMAHSGTTTKTILRMPTTCLTGQREEESLISRRTNFGSCLNQLFQSLEIHTTNQDYRTRLADMQNNVAQKANTAYSTIKVLAKANQINEIYKTDDNMAKLFAYFIALKSTCWVNSQYQHGSLFPNNLSLYRMYGNGTFQYMIEKYRRNHGI
jgi:hypothetical protein